MKDKKYILTQEAAAEKLIRLSLEVAEHLTEENNDLILVGIQKGGYSIAKKLQHEIEKYTDVKTSLLALNFADKDLKDVTLDQSIDFNGKNILLIDDVSNSGKTMFYALRPFLDFFPNSIRTLVLVERLHKTFPIKSDFVGLTKATTVADYIHVEIENDEVLGAYIDEIANYANKK